MEFTFAEALAPQEESRGAQHASQQPTHDSLDFAQERGNPGKCSSFFCVDVHRLGGTMASWKSNGHLSNAGVVVLADRLGLRS
jgi:hypothetical protein